MNKSSQRPDYEGLEALSDEPFGAESKVLGYAFSPSEDMRGTVLNERCSTKRQVLSSLVSIFDPLGLLSPLLIPAKLFVRELSHSKYKWDETISQAHARKWLKICTDFASTVEETKFDFPRMAAFSNEPAELVFFCDASKTNYGFCSYIEQNGKSNLLFAKSKLAPES